MSNTLSAQDTVKTLRMPVNRITKIKSETVQQTITQQINFVLVSLISNTKGSELFVKNVITSIEAVLYRNWKAGKLIGTKPSQAYFVQCGPQTMTQENSNKGLLIVSVGIACYKPAEFELLRFERMITGKKIIFSY
jgi:phage tail sheath protein FI